MLRPFESAYTKLNSLVKRSRHSRTATRRLAMAVESLEPRRLLSVSVDNGVLYVNGPVGSDHITISLVAGNQNELQVVGAGDHKPTFAVSSVSEIFAQGQSSGDFIEISDTNGEVQIPAELIGGSSADTLTGGSYGHDTLMGGKGADLLTATGGESQVRAAKGADRIVATGGGGDTLYGGLGRNLIADSGTDQIVNNPSGTNTVNSGGAAVLTPDIIFSGGGTAPTGVNNPFVLGYTPTQIRNAYNLGDLGDASFTNRGQGQQIAIVDAFDDPTILSDLTTFSTEFGLPVPTSQTFEKVYASGNQPAASSIWDGEISLDVEWAHAIAPDAKIILVEADSDMTEDLFNAVQVASNMLENPSAGFVAGGSLSMSFGGGESILDLALDQDVFDNPAILANVSFIASAGDVGGEVSYPAMSPYVTSVGGTELFLDEDGGRIIPTGEPASEIAWADGGGGVSTIEPSPVYQGGLPTPATRVGPDVAWDADPSTGPAIYFSSPNPAGDTGWEQIGGTSFGSPSIAAVVALANQVRQSAHMGEIGANLNNAIYLLNTDFPTGTHLGGTVDARDFNDIIFGAAGANAAGIGYDLATGWGTPNAQGLIPDLAALANVGEPSEPIYSEAVDIPELNYTADYEIPSGQGGLSISAFAGDGTAISTIGTDMTITLDTPLTAVNGTFFGEPGPSPAPIIFTCVIDPTTGTFTGFSDAGATSTTTSNGFTLTSASGPADLYIQGTVGGTIGTNGVLDQTINGTFYAVQTLTANDDGTVSPGAPAALDSFQDISGSIGINLPTSASYINVPNFNYTAQYFTSASSPTTPGTDAVDNFDSLTSATPNFVLSFGATNILVMELATTDELVDGTFGTDNAVALTWGPVPGGAGIANFPLGMEMTYDPSTGAFTGVGQATITGLGTPLLVYFSGTISGSSNPDGTSNQSISGSFYSVQYVTAGPNGTILPGPVEPVKSGLDLTGQFSS
jgi:hypothetical protein